jgi:hypothetical protein
MNKVFKYTDKFALVVYKSKYSTTFVLEDYAYGEGSEAYVLCPYTCKLLYAPTLQVLNNLDHLNRSYLEKGFNHSDEYLKYLVRALNLMSLEEVESSIEERLEANVLSIPFYSPLSKLQYMLWKFSKVDDVLVLRIDLNPCVFRNNERVV